MFDVEKIKEQVIEKPVLIFFDSKDGFADFCRSFLVDYLNDDENRHIDFEYLMSVWEDYYGKDSDNPNNCAVELSMSEFGSDWGHCWREWFEEAAGYKENYTIIHYTEFLLQSIKVSKNGLIDFLNA